MSKIEYITCDKCGKELPAYYNLKDYSARLDVYEPGKNRSNYATRLDLCEECYQKFITWLESGE